MENTTNIPAVYLWVPVAAAIAGSLITGITAWVISMGNRKSELERTRTQAMITAAIESWRISIELAKGQQATISPLDAYILHMYKFSNIVFDPTTNQENIEARLAELAKFGTAAQRHWKDDREDSNDK